MSSRMRSTIKVKTDYKYSTVKYKQSSMVATVASKWRLPLALGALGFVIAWRCVNWFTPYNPEQTEEEWLASQQVTMNVALPETEEVAPKPIATLIKETPLLAPVPTSAQATDPWQTFTIKAGDNLAYYFQQAGLTSKTLDEVMSVRQTQHLKKIFPGQTLRINADDNGKLIALQFDVDPLTTLMVQRQANGDLVAKVEEKPIEKRVAFGGGQINDSLFLAAKHAKLDDALIMELANIFAYDIDFAQDIQPNDNFKVLYEEYFVNGVKVGNGPIVAAEFTNNGKEYRAIRYTDSDGISSYFSPLGQSLKKAFIRTPVQYTRISSHFNLHRRHPVLHKIRAHRGVDYAAPTGTPVKAAGQGKIVFVGRKGGYGNTIVLQHGSKYTTLYGHLSRFSKNLKSGMTVKQGQVIGFVGSTGLASGPHLHFEFRINGVHHDPLKVALPQADGLTGKAKTQFLAHTKELLGVMARHEKTMIASNEY
jgi:murein DD-endopeptidase MepM/ murein hydrolase activator NlpD